MQPDLHLPFASSAASATASIAAEGRSVICRARLLIKLRQLPRPTGEQGYMVQCVLQPKELLRHLVLIVCYEALLHAPGRKRLTCCATLVVPDHALQKNALNVVHFKKPIPQI